MSDSDDRVVEPVEYELARVEGAASLLSEPPTCIHCKLTIEVDARLKDSDLPRALGVTHEPDCPLHED